MDSRFKVEVINQSPNPQQIIYSAMHQDYSDLFVWDERDSFPSEEKCGEIIVNRLLKGDRGHYGCYSADTEVLTEKGWMFWEDLCGLLQERGLCKVLAVNIERGECHFEQPSRVQKVRLFEGDKLYNVSSQYLNFAVTHDHRMVVSSRRKDGSFTEWSFKSASEVCGSPVRYLLNSCLSSGDRLPPPETPESITPEIAFKLAGFFFGDGVRSLSKNPKVIRFRIRRPRKIAYLLSLGLPSEEKVGDRYTVYHAELAEWIHRYFSSPSGKVVPDWMLRLPENMIAAFWDGLKNSDGTNVTEKSWSYDSTQKEAIDIIQAIAHINGFSANMTLNNPNEGYGHENHKPCWRLTISEHSTRRVETCQKGRSPGVSEGWISYDGFVYCATVSTGALMVRRQGKVMVSGNCLEHPQITFNCGFFPHSTMQQLRTHRVGISFDVSSFRYNSQSIIDAANGQKYIDEVFYLRPVGEYRDRSGKKYEYTQYQRLQDENLCKELAIHYSERIVQGFSEEHARGLIPFDVRQNWVMSVNVRSLMHLLDLRWKADAQLECQQLCDLLFPHFRRWVPAIADWYKQNRAGKARLSP